VNRRSIAALAAALSASVAVAGCNFNGAYSLPLPGGASHGPQITLTAVFGDVQDLVPDAAVRIDDVPAGDVTNITLGPDLKAHVTLSVNASAAAKLPYNAVATLDQTSLLGEKYIALAPPADAPPQGQLQSGEVLKDGQTATLKDVEQVFGALSTVLNGGDLQDLQTINVEITKALQGREQQVRGALTQITRFVSDLNNQRHQIVRALDELQNLSGVLANQTGDIQTALTQLGPGLKVLADENPQFVNLLQGLSHFGRITRHLIGASRANTVANLRELKPILSHLAAAGSNLPHALELLVTYPFPRNDQADTPGDYTGLNLSFCPTASTTACTSPPVTSPLDAVCSLLGAIGLSVVDGACPTTSVTKPLGGSGHHRHRGGTHGKGGGKGGGGLPIPLPTPSVSIPPLPIPSPTGSSLLGGLLGGGLTGTRTGTSAGGGTGTSADSGAGR
jgi:phospholipid/cholesterol/gamma-HCH transport system substrate-binding protein